MTLPSQDELRRILRYDEDAGVLFFRERDIGCFNGSEDKCAAWNKRYAGKPSGSFDGKYLRVSVRGTQYRVHRVIWKYVHGVDAVQIDHINGNMLDNRLCNLRNATHSENMRNRRVNSRNKWGMHGIHYLKRSCKFQVKCLNKYIGEYDTLDEAKRCRREAEVMMGVHPNHGRER